MLNNLLQSNCILCDEIANHHLAICEACLDSLPWVKEQTCTQCGLRANASICGKCLNEPPHYDRTVAVFDYAYPVDALIQAFKYQQKIYLSQTFAAFIHRKVSQVLVDTIIAMPLHPNRLLTRGYNQSLEIAKIVSKLKQSSLMLDACSRIKDTPPQASLPLKARIQNMQHAFSCQDSVSGLHIAIVDDVMTSGASLNALAKTLKDAGASSVSCWVLARTPE